MAGFEDPRPVLKLHISCPLEFRPNTDLNVHTLREMATKVENKDNSHKKYGSEEERRKKERGRKKERREASKKKEREKREKEARKGRKKGRKERRKEEKK